MSLPAQTLFLNRNDTGFSAKIIERNKSIGRVPKTLAIIEEYPRTGSRVLVAGTVVKKRERSHGRVVVAPLLNTMVAVPIVVLLPPVSFTVL